MDAVVKQSWNSLKKMPSLGSSRLHLAIPFKSMVGIQDLKYFGKTAIDISKDMPFPFLKFKSVFNDGSV